MRNKTQQGEIEGELRKTEQWNETTPNSEGPNTKSSAHASIGACERMAFSLEECAKLLGISVKSVRRLIERGLLKPSRALRHLRISRVEIEKFLERTAF